MHLFASALLLLAPLWRQGCCMALFMALSLGAQAGTPLVLTQDRPQVNAWEHLSIHADSSNQLTVQDMLGRLDAFEAPPHRGGSLGVHKAAMWLHLPLIVHEKLRTPWVVDIGYSSLQSDIYLTSGGQVLQQVNTRAHGKADAFSRTPSMEFDLQPGRAYDLLIRVHATGPLILPITLTEMPLHMREALGEQMLQGLLNGLALCLLLYSLVQWVTQRDALFGWYALVVLGSACFSLQFFGIGAQFLWTGNAWLGRHVGPVAGLVALAGSFLFLGAALAEQPQSRYARTMRAGAAITAAVCIAVTLGWLSIGVAIAFMSLVGPLPSLISLPAAIARVRRKDPIGSTLLMAWTVYGVAALIMVCLVQGWVPANFWTLHSFQFGATLDMLLFLRVMGLRASALKRKAHEAMRERDIMHTLAHSDPLTGLHNRRGLQQALQGALTTASPRSLVAVYLMDLDGFKPVNDTHGHDVGDDLLVAVGHRLVSNVRRHTDVVARLGGDEFIIMATQLDTPQQAQELGHSLLQAFEQPIVLSHLRLHVGLTIGYALAPFDGDDAQGLIRQADSAMYEGKQSGKRTIRRATLPALPAT